LSIYVKDSKKPAKACVIWMHGLGADAQDMAQLAEQFQNHEYPMRHVFLDAPVRKVTINNGMSMRAWYDITGITLTARHDDAGIQESFNLIRQVIETQIHEGFTSEQIFLAGFSQGGAMALYTALHTEGTLGGVISMSAYLPLADQCLSKLNKNTPFFMATGVLDTIVLPAWTSHAKEWLETAGYSNISWHQYPMEHSICMQEVTDLSIWFSKQLGGE
jgi:phospholipase/carboxylesterase